MFPKGQCFLTDKAFKYVVPTLIRNVWKMEIIRDKRQIVTGIIAFFEFRGNACNFSSNICISKPFLQR